jgi:hypothetical protein
LPGDDVDAELEFHFTEAIEALVAQGWPPDRARVEAERRFGDRRRYQHTSPGSIGRTFDERDDA